MFGGIRNRTKRERRDKNDWKKGVCRIRSCDSKGKLIEVGPCRICKSCEKKFDEGRDPTLEQPKTQDKDEKTFQNIVSEMIKDAQDFANNSESNKKLKSMMK
ncbi:MAG: hypothetical protein AAB914_01590 [Patescibacteria group bacterium]